MIALCNAIARTPLYENARSKMLYARPGDGFVNFSELQEAMQAASKTLGIPGSPWKMYIDPAQSVMVYHDIRCVHLIYAYVYDKLSV